MSDVVIRAEGLGKAYQIRHEAEHGPTRFSELLTETVAGLFRGGRRQGGPTHETFWALRDVSFEVREGEVVGIIGRNGAGKSTLLKVLSRITEPTEGRVELRGRVASLLEVGTGFHPELTGRENIYLNGAILGMSRAEIRRKFDEIVNFAGVEKFLDTPVKRYSSGMYVRLAFAVAAHLEPEILVVDEVLAVGDAEFQRKCLGKMGEVSKGGRTVLFVSHNMGAVQALCERTINLHHAGIRWNGRTADVIDKYLHSLREIKKVPLTDRRDRKGTGLIQITSVELRSKKSGLVVRMGDPLEFTIRFVAQQPLPRVNFTIQINDLMGNNVLRLSTHESLHTTSLEAGYNTAICSTEPVNLNSGIYSILVAASKPPFWEHLDYVADACFLEIVKNDVFKTGRTPMTGLIFVRSSWKFDAAYETSKMRDFTA